MSTYVATMAAYCGIRAAVALLELWLADSGRSPRVLAMGVAGYTAAAAWGALAWLQ